MIRKETYYSQKTLPPFIGNLWFFVWEFVEAAKPKAVRRVGVIKGSLNVPASIPPWDTAPQLGRTAGQDGGSVWQNSGNDVTQSLRLKGNPCPHARSAAEFFVFVRGQRRDGFL